MPDQTTTTTKTAPSPDRMSLGALILVLALTNVRFFTQVLGYVS